MGYARNSGVRIHYSVEGAGPPLVLLHGFAGSLATWHEFGFAADLSRDYQLILIDARGHGQSDKPHATAAYDLGLMASDLVAVLDELGIERAHFLGYSMGGRIGLRIAAQGLLGRFQSLIIGGASPYPPTTEAALASGRRVHAATLRGAEAVAAWFEEQGGPLPPAERTRILENDMAALVALRTQPIAPAGSLEQVNAYLGTFTVPVLVYAGTEDAYCEPASEAANQMPRATLARIEGRNHIETYFGADRVLPHVRRFLSSVEAAQA